MYLFGFRLNFLKLLRVLFLGFFSFLARHVFCFSVFFLCTIFLYVSLLRLRYTTVQKKVLEGLRSLGKLYNFFIHSSNVPCFVLVIFSFFGGNRIYVENLGNRNSSKNKHKSAAMRACSLWRWYGMIWYTYIYIYTYIYCVYIYIYTYIYMYACMVKVCVPNVNVASKTN